MKQAGSTSGIVAIQGAPERVQDDVWNYGSSWVRFEDGHVVDWASVPPNRLMTLTPRPVKEDENGEEEATAGDEENAVEMPIAPERFAEMARFNYGSTVIVLLPPGVAEFAPTLHAESAVQLGQALARLRG